MLEGPDWSLHPSLGMAQPCADLSIPAGHVTPQGAASTHGAVGSLRVSGSVLSEGQDLAEKSLPSTSGCEFA